MMDVEQLRQAFPFMDELSASDIFDFLKRMSPLKLSPGDIFLQVGAVEGYIYFVRKGLIRSFYVDEKGNEITNRLRYENQVMSCYEIDLLHRPSRFNLQALEPTELLVMEVKTMRKIIESNPNVEVARRYFLTNGLAEALSALDDFLLLSPEKRYLKFLDEHPDLLNRVPMKYIANVLGITPVSLSRIRKRVASKKL